MLDTHTHHKTNMFPGYLPLPPHVHVLYIHSSPPLTNTGVAVNGDSKIISDDFVVFISKFVWFC